MLRKEPITKENLEFALKVFHSIFTWMEPNVNPYADALNGKVDAEYYLVYDDETLVGITGFYTLPEDPESAWLGWFGVVPEQRRNHYGSKIVQFHENDLKEQGFKYSRLYTEIYNNDATRRFYEKCGYTGEPYNNSREPELLNDLLMTYSKSLGDWPLVPWDSRYMGFYEAEKGFYTEEQLANAAEMIQKAKEKAHS